MMRATIRPEAVRGKPGSVVQRVRCGRPGCGTPIGALGDWPRLGLRLGLSLRDDPSATALYTITRSLQGIAAGQAGASPMALIARGVAMIKSFRPVTRVAWATQAVAAADFWAAASRFQPHLVEQERLAREALKANRVVSGREVTR